MARHYSTKSFFRQTPNALLARYFADRGHFCDLDFAAMKETKPDELFAVWLDLPEEQRKPMDAEFQDVFELSCEKGFLAIIDEAHRSVYQKYGAIFRYFDSLLVGLTATPREEVDKNTYDLFELEPGVPTDAYELTEAVNDGFLVPPRVEQVDLRFPREGIDYDSLSDEEKAQWESLDWGD